MFTVEIKASQPWRSRNQMMKAERWTTVARLGSQTDAEKEVSWFAHDIEQNTHYLKSFTVEYRIRQGDEVVWGKTEALS